jgi:hypothetical protein
MVRLMQGPNKQQVTATNSGGVTLFPQVEGLKLFSISMNRYGPLLSYNVSSGSFAIGNATWED